MRYHALSSGLPVTTIIKCIALAAVVALLVNATVVVAVALLAWWVLVPELDPHAEVDPMKGITAVAILLVGLSLSLLLYLKLERWALGSYHDKTFASRFALGCGTAALTITPATLLFLSMLR